METVHIHKGTENSGQTKQEEELTNEEKLERRIQQIERENERLRAENLMNREFSASRPDENKISNASSIVYIYILFNTMMILLKKTISIVLK